MGEAQDTETQALKEGVPSAVALEGVAVPVMTKPIGLDDQAAVTPEEVDLVGAHASVDLRLRKAVAPAEGEKEALELAAGEVRWLAQIGAGDQPQVERAADRRTEQRLGNGAVKVAEGAGGLRHCDAVAAGRSSGNEGVGSMHPDSLSGSAASVTWDGGLDRSRVGPQHPPDGGSAPAADGRPFPESKHGRHAARLEGEAGVADGVHPAVKAVKSSCPDSAGDCVLVGSRPLRAGPSSPHRAGEPRFLRSAHRLWRLPRAYRE